MPIYINVLPKEGEYERDRFNLVDMSVLERQLRLFESMCDGYELKGEDANDAMGLSRLLTRVLVDLKLGSDATLFRR
jgi:hypothetical protein